jgi:hypothetical protein
MASPPGASLRPPCGAGASARRARKICTCPALTRNHGACAHPLMRCSSARIPGAMGIEISGIGGLILLVLNVWAIISIVGSDASTGGKVIWTLVILFLPLIGFIAWLIAGPRSKGR